MNTACRVFRSCWAQHHHSQNIQKKNIEGHLKFMLKTWDYFIQSAVSTKQTRLTKLSGMSLQGCRPQNLSRNSGTREHDMTVKTSTESQMHVTRRPVCSHWWSAVFVVINGNLITFFFFFYRKIQVIVSSEVRLPAGEHLKLPSFQRAARIHTLHSIPIA